jgi:hypothetical protein
MRILALVLLVLTSVGLAFAQYDVEVGGPTQTQDPAYPLRVRILQRSWSRDQWGERMWGRGDLFIGQQEQGFDYESTCGERFMVSHGAELYSARWKKPNEQLEMLVSRMGTGKSDKCVLKADVKDYVYEYKNGAVDGAIITRPVASAAPGNSPAGSSPNR